MVDDFPADPASEHPVGKSSRSVSPDRGAVGRVQQLVEQANARLTGNPPLAAQYYFEALVVHPDHAVAVQGLVAAMQRLKTGKREVLKAMEASRRKVRELPVAEYLKAMLAYAAGGASLRSSVDVAERARNLGFRQVTNLLICEVEKALPAAKLNSAAKATLHARIAELLEFLSDDGRDVKILERAIASIQRAVHLAPNDPAYRHKHRELDVKRLAQYGEPFKSLAFPEARPCGEPGDKPAEKPLDLHQRLRSELSDLERTCSASDEIVARKEQILQWARLVPQVSDPQLEQAALDILAACHEQTRDRDFELWAGELRIGQARRLERELGEKLEQDPGNEELQARHADAQAALSGVEVTEYERRVRDYPNEPRYKLELAKRLVERDQPDRALPLLQTLLGPGAKETAEARFWIGKAFLKKEWYDEAMEAFRWGTTQAVEPRLELHFKYGLTLALLGKAKSEKDRGAAREGRKIAAEILVEDVNFCLIRQLREELQALLTSTTPPGAEHNEPDNPSGRG